MFRVRAFWERLPWSSTVGTPEALSCLESFLAPCLVRVKTIVRPGADVRSTSTGRRASWCTWKMWCAIVEIGDWAESAWCVTGLVRKRLPRTSRPARESGNVAAWIGVGMVIPAAVRTAVREEGTPKLAKVVSEDTGGYSIGVRGSFCPAQTHAVAARGYRHKKAGPRQNCADRCDQSRGSQGHR